MCGNWPNIIFYLNQKKLNQIPSCHPSAHAIWDMMLTRFCYSQAPYSSPQLPYCHILHSPPPPTHTVDAVSFHSKAGQCVDLHWTIADWSDSNLTHPFKFSELSEPCVCCLATQSLCFLPCSLSPAHMLKKQLFPLGKWETSCYSFYI